ncbi:MAG: glycosyltransferase [Clostridium sp.]|uniref:glycosyltransferase n=1 Tax=Clostridium sp. TaxID=1506 RepID=UPI0032171AD1
MDVKISVIIPVYNVGNYIVKTIESLNNQTFKDFEVIVVNDGSTDNSKKVTVDNLEKYDLNYTIINKDNQGVSIARNIGIDKSKGEYIYFLDGDDYVEPTFLEKLYSYTSSNGVDIAFCGYTHLNAKDNYSEAARVHKYIDKIIDGREAAARMLRSEFWISAISGFYRRDFIEENNLRFPTDIKFGEDTVFIIKTLMNSKRVGCVKEPLVNYVRRSSSVTKTPSDTYYNLYESDIRILNYNQETIKDKEIEEALITYHIPRNIIRIFSTMAKGGGDKEKLITFIKKDEIAGYLKKFKTPSKKFKVAAIVILKFPTIAFLILNFKLKIKN